MDWRTDPVLWRDQDRLRELLRRERGWQCEYCGERQWSQLHHAFIRRDKHQSLLDAAINLQCCCAVCHVQGGLLDSKANRAAFKREQERRGYDVDGWLASLPLKVKPVI